jgi:hypothetical protein
MTKTSIMFLHNMKCLSFDNSLQKFFLAILMHILKIPRKRHLDFILLLNNLGFDLVKKKTIIFALSMTN